MSVELDHLDLRLVDPVYFDVHGIEEPMILDRAVLDTGCTMHVVGPRRLIGHLAGHGRTDTLRGLGGDTQADVFDGSPHLFGPEAGTRPW